MHKNILLKKGLVVGIILLLVGISVLFSVSSKDVSVSNGNILEVVECNDEVEPLDNYEEIMTRVTTQVYDVYDAIIFDNRIFFNRLQISRENSRNINLKGYRVPTVDSPRFSYEVNVDEAYADTFLLTFSTPDSAGGWYITGYVFGNIEWE